MELRLGHVVDVRTNETGGLALADEWRSGGDDGLSARDVHDLEEEPRAAGRQRETQRISWNTEHSQAADEPLHDTEVVHHLHEGNEEDDGRQLETCRA